MVRPSGEIVKENEEIRVIEGKTKEKRAKEKVEKIIVVHLKSKISKG